MRDPRLDKLADVLVRYSTRVKPGDLVTIVGEPHAFDAARAVYESVLRSGGHPSFHVRSESLIESLVRTGSDAQLQHVCPFERYRLERCDVLIVLMCPRNTRYLEHADPARIAMMRAARKELLSLSLARKAAGQTRYVLTEIPGQAAAHDAGMSLPDYEDWVFKAGMLDLPDPVAGWKAQRDRQEQAREYLQRVHELRFRSPAHGKHDGTDLRVDVSGRTWINHAGGENFPDGEVETGPREVDGVVNFNIPSIYLGREVDGVRLKFQAGRVVEASATRNEDYLLSLLDLDAGSRIAGEIALGTNYALKVHTRAPFFDEKIGGTFHLALGAGYPETGNRNESALHWDLVCDLRPRTTGTPGGTIDADGVTIQRDGKFLFEGWPGC